MGVLAVDDLCFPYGVRDIGVWHKVDCRLGDLDGGIAEEEPCAMAVIAVPDDAFGVEVGEDGGFIVFLLLEVLLFLVLDYILFCSIFLVQILMHLV